MHAYYREIDKRSVRFIRKRLKEAVTLFVNIFFVVILVFICKIIVYKVDFPEFMLGT